VKLTIAAIPPKTPSIHPVSTAGIGGSMIRKKKKQGKWGFTCYISFGKTV